MWLTSLHLKDFRNYQDTEISFNPELNVFLGQNAQGKTNILEAIYFLALTRSHRTRHDKDLIHFEKSQLKLSGSLSKTAGSIPLEIEVTPKGRITKINHLKQARLSDYIGTMNVVLFAPEDLQLIKGAPSIRRKFIDMELGQMKPIYLADLSSYNHVLKQRNSYLKTSQQVDETFLSVLDEQLADFGSRVIRHRLQFLEKLQEFGRKKHWEISNQTEELSITYQSSVSYVHLDELETVFKNALRQSRKRDLFKKNTGIGPHRDDISFYINGMNADFGSQGQHRSLVLSIKLAEIELMEFITREAPILLLDDVMSELDNHRQIKLLETISQNIQTFITTTSLEHLHTLPENIQIFQINQGNIQKSEK